MDSKLPCCPKCLKSETLCICKSIQPFSTRLHVLFLQHPQEPNEELSSTRLAHLALSNSSLKIGLSWPNLRAALGWTQQAPLQPSQWAVLYLGSGVKGPPTQSSLQFVDRKGMPLPPPSEIHGIIILDGTWSQAKALWWRNPWLLKLKRAILSPHTPSLYRELRKEPRRECISTLESAAEALSALGESPEVSQGLRTVFSEFLKNYRAVKNLSRKTKTTHV